MNEFDLDLSVYAPKPKRVKLDSDTYIEVLPPKLFHILELQSVFSNLESHTVEELRNKFKPLIPQIDDIDFTVEQFQVLTDFLMKMSQPKDAEALKEVGVTLDGGEKK
jgi:hypothetical protein